MPKKQKKKRREAARPTIPLDRILVYSLAFVLFALPLFIVPGISEYGYGKTIVALIAVSILSILWGLSRWHSGTWSVRLPWITFPFLGFVLASLLSLIHATNGRVVVQSLVLVVFFFQLLLIIANVIREKRDVVLVLFSLLTSTFLVALYGLLQYLGIMEGAPGELGLDAIITTLGNRNFLGGVLGYLLYPSVILLLRLRSRPLRIAAILLIAFSFGTTMLVQQTAALAVLIGASLTLLVGWLVFRPVQPIRRSRAWLLALLLVLALTYLVEAPSGPLNSVVGLSSDGPSWIGRVWERNSGRTRELDWWVAWEMFKDHPLTGVGLGNYKLAFVPYKAVFHETPRGSAYTNLRIARAAQAHNDYIQIGAELGVFGILALVGLIVALPLTVWRRIRRNPDEGDRLDLLLLAAGLVGFLVHAAVSFPAHLPTSSLVAIAMTGLIFSPAYGSAGTTTVTLRGRARKAAVAGVAVVGLAVCIVAARDLAADFLMSEGIDQLRRGQISAATGAAREAEPLFQEAESSFQKSIALDFAARQTYFRLAEVQIQQGRYEEAFENIERCLTRFVDENVFLAYGELGARLGRTDEAREAIELLLSSNPTRRIELNARYVEAKIAIEDGEYTEATRLLQAITEDAPDFELAYIHLGLLFAARGMPADARTSLDQALIVIDEQLGDAQLRLSELSRQVVVSTEEYSELSRRISALEQERSYVLSKLGELPAL